MNKRPLTKEDCRKALEWRRTVPQSLRTAFPITEDMQDEWYEHTACDRKSDHRYWSLWIGKRLVGMGGITNIQRENRIGEISLVLDPKLRGKGYGRSGIQVLLAAAFDELNLKTVIGECYECNPNVGFWKHLAEQYGWFTALLPNRKFWDGKYWDSFYFSIDEGIKQNGML